MGDIAGETGHLPLPGEPLDQGRVGQSQRAQGQALGIEGQPRQEAGRR